MLRKIKKRMKSLFITLVAVTSVVISASVIILGVFGIDLNLPEKDSISTQKVSEITESSANSIEDSLPDFKGEPYIVLNNNVPYFDLSWDGSVYETYGMDEQGRCTEAYASVCQELMPTEERGEIGSVKPSGWNQAKYDFIDGKYLYNRCHLIGYQLSGENANEKNLITGTRYLNIEGMLPFENMVADYVHETGNTVLYKVTPRYMGNEPLARGVTLEGYSVEDNGEGICFNVYCFNAQPGVSIDYATGSSVAR